jgi:putative membrane protein
MREGLLKNREGTVLAKQKTSSAEVKSFAEQMIQDHTKANQELVSSNSAVGYLRR